MSDHHRAIERAKDWAGRMATLAEKRRAEALARWQYRPDISPGEVWDGECRPVATFMDPEDEHAQPTEADIAKGHLIASAPDMLAALRRVERVMTDLGAKGEPLKTVRAAIAKAEGK